ncbi:MAG: anaerobic carbon-monoxide dehydrogenase catalytic subunit, partial [Lachnospiraceae bacterium]|nr:anaerobic carbon-monoxide dehydrogenase catalytic subunit [Lachnospiraceae bacterium]
AGSGCYTHVVENTAKRLKEMAQEYLVSGEPFPNKEAVAKLAGILQINCCGECHPGCTESCAKTAEMIAEAVLADLRKPYEEKMELIEKIALPKRYDLWKKLGILPGGAKDEIFNAVVKTSTNLNSDPMDMLLQCLRLGISTGNYGLILTNLMNDIIMGCPQISMDPVGLRIIDPEYVNIMITGHQQSMFADLEEKLETEIIQKSAELVGAKGIRIVGCTCVGQDYQARSECYKGVYCGHAGNNYTSEAVLMTGCVDLVVSEFNCSIPGIEPICEKLEIPMLCLDDVAKKVNAKLIPYCAEEKEKISSEIIAAALCGFKNRKEKISGIAPARGEKRVNAMAHHGFEKSITGLSEDTLVAALGGSLDPLINAIASGKIKGIVGIVGCSNLRAKGHDVFTVELAKELIKKDMLVLSAGCTCGGLENCGLMTMDAIELCGSGLKEVCTALGVPPVLNFGPCLAIGRIELTACALAKALDVDLPQLPVVISAPQWLEEQALADGAYALALGFPLHLALSPFVTGSKIAVTVLTEALKEITGGQLIIEGDVDAAADKFEEIIKEKRKGLGLDKGGEAIC